jgi:Kef-type K+ transport system membrane component KefB
MVVRATRCVTFVDNLPLVLGILASLGIGKWIAAEAVGRSYGYSRPARLTVWALTLPQVAATLAATLVAYDTRNAAGERMLDGKMLNTVLVLMLVTSILGPVLTERFTPRMLAEERRESADA